LRLGICHQVSLPGSWDDAITAAGALGVDGVELFIRESEAPALLEAPAMARAARAAAERVGVAIDDPVGSARHNLAILRRSFGL
jgi:hypothetical protein